MLEIALSFVVGALFGYVFRKYASKTWPTEASLLDAVAKKYGDDAKETLELFKKKLGGDS